MPPKGFEEDPPTELDELEEKLDALTDEIHQHRQDLANTLRLIDQASTEQSVTDQYYQWKELTSTCLKGLQEKELRKILLLHRRSQLLAEEQ